MVNDIKHGTVNASNRDHFGVRVNKKSEYDEGTYFGVCLQNLELYCNLQTIDSRDLRLLGIVWFFQNLGHFLLLWKTGTMFIGLCIKFLVK